MARRKQQPKSMMKRRKTNRRRASPTLSTTMAAAAASTTLKSDMDESHDPPASPDSRRQVAPSNNNCNPLAPSSVQCQATVASGLSPRQQQSRGGAFDSPHLHNTTIITKIDGHCSRSRRCRRTNDNAICPSLLVVLPTPTMTMPSTTLPLAAYPPASLFMMLLVASVLPKNTFSLRWLALSSNVVGVGGSHHHHHHPTRAAMRMGGRASALHKNKIKGRDWSGLMNSMVMGQRRNLLFYWLELLEEGNDAAAAANAVDYGNIDSKIPNRKVMLSLWDDFVAATMSLERTTLEGRICCRGTTLGSSITKEKDESHQVWSIDSIFNSIPRGGDGDGVDNSEKMYLGLVNLGNTCYLNAQLQCAFHIPYLRKLVLDAEDEVVREEVEIEVEVDDHAMDNISGQPSDETTQINADEPFQPKAKTIIVRKEIKEKRLPISHALRALKVTFNSLHNNPSSSSGSTSILCRTLGINPYLQQDGQEFWKLFIPEIDYSKLARLYSGYYEDYVREIVPENAIIDEEFVTYDYYGEEKKDDKDYEAMSKASDKKARERKRLEPFMDLSIPVSDSSSGSVDATLKEMFTQPEILRVSEGNGWRPSKGDEKVDAYKGASLKRDGLPSLLQLHLKRFKYDYEAEETSKINSRCSFPLELDLSQMSDSYCDDDDVLRDDAIYDLQSIVVHKGEYGSGHYYSYVRPEIRTNDWFRFDDEVVTRVGWADVVADAYGGRRMSRQTRCMSVSLEPPNSRSRWLFWPLLSLLRLLRRATIVGSNNTPDEGHRFGYGGETSNAYMLQYVRRADIPMLYLEETDT